MSLSRRSFVASFTSGGAASPVSLTARGREAWIGEGGSLLEAAPAPAPDAIRLNSNESPIGPGPSAVAAIEKSFAYSGRYPMNAQPAMADFRALVAKRNRLQPASVALGAGSGEILDAAVRAFVSPARRLVAAWPTFEAPARVAGRLKLPVKEVPVDADGRLDCDAMIAEGTGAGLVFVCNPNNPTATVHPAARITDLVARISKASPDTVILVDEAYHEYVTDPAYATAVPLIASHGNLLVSRTMSKAHGMAGLRLGYVMGQPDLVAKISRWMMPYNANALVVGAACASIEDEPYIARERARNTDALRFATGFFRDAGFTTTDSQTNFLWVDLRKPAKGFREACEARGVLVGRDFPPFEKTHCRISIGTMAEMQRAVEVFRTVLHVTTSSAGRQGR
jgi:histidinol-phosphate aminotransferase